MAPPPTHPATASASAAAVAAAAALPASPTALRMHDVGADADAVAGCGTVEQCLWRKCLNGMKNVAGSNVAGARAGAEGGGDGVEAGTSQAASLMLLPFTSASPPSLPSHSNWPVQC